MNGFLDRCRKRVARYRRVRATAREFAGLDDWQLKDIGINRGDIWNVASGKGTGRDPRSSV